MGEPLCSQRTPQGNQDRYTLSIGELADENLVTIGAQLTAKKRQELQIRLLQKISRKSFIHGIYRVNCRKKEGPEPTGLEPATSAVTGQRSNQLS